MPTEPDDKTKKADEQQPFKGIKPYVESGDVVGLMRELEKLPTGTQEAILNKLSISDGNGGRIELDNSHIPMPENIRKQAEKQLKKKQQQEQGDAT
jgi:hypothetical protein